MPDEPNDEAKPKSPLDKARQSHRLGRRFNEVEKATVTQYALTHPVTQPKDVTALAAALDRTEESIRDQINLARRLFLGNAGDYVDLHKKMVQAAADAGPDSRGFAEAIRGAQWAMERMRSGETSIVERIDNADTGNKIVIGVKVGGAADV